MVTVILTHEVADFATWKKGFELGEPLRQQAGVKTVGIFNSIENPNLVSAITEFPSKEAVQGFMSNPALKAEMEKAGVVGVPEVKILNKI